MIRRPPRSTRTDTLFPYTTLFRSAVCRSLFGLWSPVLVADARVPPGGRQRYPFDEMDPRTGNGLSRCQYAVESLRSEEHTSELQSLMRISYAVFCLKKKKTSHNHTHSKSY